MTCARRSGALKASSALLVAGFVAAGLAAGAGSGTAATGDALRAPAPACTSAQVAATDVRTTGSGAVVTVTNGGPKTCVLNGFPSVALAGQGSPDKNKPLRVLRQGRSAPVKLAPGARASARLSFVPVLGEGEGYCAAGGEPFVAPTMVVGVAGGRYQIAPTDGSEFALCGNTVRSTAFRAAGS
ncbi:DUF4232 domain-containing protein [Streptomyces sp. NPDC056387]|uniref:DUF4232 domain-containing protein n=1 Tax=Streptomyces sp. NPDC056387 TaxID=3345803 RepID=UPI0035DCCAF5